MTNIKKSIKRNYQSWSGSLKEKRNDDVMDFTEYIKDHEKRALEQRKLDRMEKRQTKLNLIKDGLEEQQTKRHLSASSRQHHNMRNARSVKYRPDEMSKQAGENIHPDGTADAGTNNKKLVLREPLEIFVDGPFGSPSSNITRAEHAVLIGTGIGREHFNVNFTKVCVKVSRHSPPSSSPSCTDTGATRSTVPSVTTPGPITTPATCST